MGMNSNLTNVEFFSILITHSFQVYLQNTINRWDCGKLEWCSTFPKTFSPLTQIYIRMLASLKLQYQLRLLLMELKDDEYVNLIPFQNIHSDNSPVTTFMVWNWAMAESAIMYVTSSTKITPEKSINVDKIKCNPCVAPVVITMSSLLYDEIWVNWKRKFNEFTLFSLAQLTHRRYPCILQTNTLQTNV